MQGTFCYAIFIFYRVTLKLEKKNVLGAFTSVFIQISNYKMGQSRQCVVSDKKNKAEYLLNSCFVGLGFLNE